MRYVAIDPGGTTGVACFDQETSEREGLLQIWVGQMGPYQHHRELYDLLTAHEPHIVICEGFEYRNRSRPGLELVSREYIGVAKLYTDLHRDVSYVEQTASMALSFVKDANLKKADLWAKGMQHGRDATRHLLYYLINTNGDGDLRLRLLKKGWDGDPRVLAR
jgi:hypothetical protein